MRISDGSSNVCSSDLAPAGHGVGTAAAVHRVVADAERHELGVVVADRVVVTGTAGDMREADDRHALDVVDLQEIAVDRAHVAHERLTLPHCPGGEPPRKVGKRTGRDKVGTTVYNTGNTD